MLDNFGHSFFAIEAEVFVIIKLVIIIIDFMFFPPPYSLFLCY